MNEAHTWVDVALALVAASPGVIAALSSLRNGKEQRRVREELKKTNGHIEKISRARKPAKSPPLNGLQPG